MKGEKCLKCKKSMGNSGYYVVGSDGNTYPVHWHCRAEEMSLSQEDFVNKYLENKEERK